MVKLNLWLIICTVILFGFLKFCITFLGLKVAKSKNLENILYKQNLINSKCVHILQEDYEKSNEFGHFPKYFLLLISRPLGMLDLKNYFLGLLPCQKLFAWVDALYLSLSTPILNITE